MTAPWNVRVTPMFLSKFREALRYKPEYFKLEVRIRGIWFDAGTMPTWLEAFLTGLRT